MFISESIAHTVTLVLHLVFVIQPQPDQRLEMRISRDVAIPQPPLPGTSVWLAVPDAGPPNSLFRLEEAIGVVDVNSLNYDTIDCRYIAYCQWGDDFEHDPLAEPVVASITDDVLTISAITQYLEQGGWEVEDLHRYECKQFQQWRVIKFNEGGMHELN